GPTSRFESTYTDIVEAHRLVFTYDMWVNDQHLSTSLTTIVVEPDGDNTRLTYTEQGVHFDGLDSVEGREEGTRGLLENIASFLARPH
ncbi:MAG TPA: SRPBCC domain-containing protein, partial [Acidimicrobiales bacterium]|nr:SRPBCC domain-containing protein [Acidimicrobiales bacterium]